MSAEKNPELQITLTDDGVLQFDGRITDPVVAEQLRRLQRRGMTIEEAISTLLRLGLDAIEKSRPVDGQRRVESCPPHEST